ncbi:translation initiation factor IF-3 [Prosthecobacter sp.]|uniref:translation initiation factor IF-3 n=1 Tax=Prosthecobacter sp. TaxID=1965333 RepID=UPI0037838DB6
MSGGNFAPRPQQNQGTGGPPRPAGPAGPANSAPGPGARPTGPAGPALGAPRPAGPARPAGGYQGSSGAFRPGGGGNRPGGRDRPNGRFVDQTRVNERIRAPKVRVVEEDGQHQLGVIPTSQAIRIAKERGLDLVEVAPNADPPVCKIVNYGKYKYIQEKHKKEAHKHQKGGKVKEMKFRIGIDPHDYLIKITHAEDFLAEGHKVRIQLQFRGRQMAHQELGHLLAKKIKADLLTMGHVDQDPRMAGRNINMQLSPLPERQRQRKFKTHLKGVTEHKDIEHHEGHDPREDKHDEHDDLHDDHHDDHLGDDHDEHPVQAAPPPAE